MARETAAAKKKRLAAETKALAKKKSSVPAKAMDFSADAGKGNEGADKDCFAIPYLSVLQKMSPQCDEVVGAKAGMLINTITNELFDEVLIIPCAFQRRFLRFVPRDAGGGYKGDYSPIDIELGKIKGVELNDDGFMVIEGDDLVDTRKHFVLVKSKTGNWFPALFSLSGTKVKKSKSWMALINGLELKTVNGRPYTPPSYSHIYSVATVKEENDKGKWFNVAIMLEEVISDAVLYAKAKAFNKASVAGDVEENEPESQTPGSSDIDDDDVGF
jgi:hypothetical protein